MRRRRDFATLLPRRLSVLAVLSIFCAAGSLPSPAACAGAAVPVGSLRASSPNGKEIAFVVPSQFSFRVDVMSASGASRRVVATSGRGEAAAELRWAGNRRLIVSTSPDGQLESIDLVTGTTIRLGGSPGGTGSGVGPLSLGANDTFVVSADGALVAYVADSPYITENTPPHGFRPQMFAIGVVHASGGAWHLLPQPIDASDAAPSFSSHATEVVFERSVFTNGVGSKPSLFEQSVSGGQARRLKSGAKR